MASTSLGKRTPSSFRWPMASRRDMPTISASCRASPSSTGRSRYKPPETGHIRTEQVFRTRPTEGRARKTCQFLGLRQDCGGRNRVPIREVQSGRQLASAVDGRLRMPAAASAHVNCELPVSKRSLDAWLPQVHRLKVSRNILFTDKFIRRSAQSRRNRLG
jgi:hypothetical protein